MDLPALYPAVLDAAKVMVLKSVTRKKDYTPMLINMDFYLFHVINQLAGTVTVLNPIMRLLSQDAEYIFYLGVIVYWFTRIPKNRTMVIEALLSACLGMAISGLLGHLFYRDRPFVAHSVIQLIPHAANASFPSDHAVAAFSIAMAIWHFRKSIGKVWLILAACIAFSRIWTGVHYPSDVIAGAFIGILAASGVHLLLTKWKPAQNLLLKIVAIYDKIEQRVWPKPIQKEQSH
jgi:undecaprenyl-diphosphatase